MEDNENPVPLPTFEELGFGDPLLRAFADAGYAGPMPVQAACAAPVLAGRHLVVRSKTGSGKTAAFAGPLLQRLTYEPGPPQVLCLAPTRELALQDHAEFEKLGKYLPVRTVAIYGGTGFKVQLDKLEAGVQVVVGTPGRVLDHYRRGTLNLSAVRTLVLDEADEMLSAGFYEDIVKVFAALRQLKQTLLYSATVPPHIEKLINRHMKDALRIDLSTDRVDVDRIENIAYLVDPSESRLRGLIGVMEAEDPACAIIFCNTKSNTEVVTKYLRRRGYDAALLNSNLSQTAREQVMGRMKAGQQRLLVATDIAARGIDISFLPYVINFEPPDDTELYIHRTGRTGRVDRKGRAVTLVAGRDIHNIRKLEARYGIKLSRQEMPTREETLIMLADRRIREMKERIEGGVVIPDEFIAIAKELMTDPDAESLVAMLVDKYMAQAVKSSEQILERPPEHREHREERPREGGGGARGGGGGGGRRRR